MEEHGAEGGLELHGLFAGSSIPPRVFHCMRFIVWFGFTAVCGRRVGDHPLRLGRVRPSHDRLAAVTVSSQRW